MNLNLDPNEINIFENKKISVNNDNVLQNELQDYLLERSWILRVPDEFSNQINAATESHNEEKSSFIFKNITESEAAKQNIVKPEIGIFDLPQPDINDKNYKHKIQEWDDRKTEFDQKNAKSLSDQLRDLNRNFKFVFSFVDHQGNTTNLKGWATLFDLPTRIETQKTFDNQKTNFKANDICQVFWVHDKKISPSNQVNWRSQLLAQFPKYLFNSKKDFINQNLNTGLLPPTRQIKQKIQSKNQINKLSETNSDTLKEVVDLINQALNNSLQDKNVTSEKLVLLKYNNEKKDFEVTDEEIDQEEFRHLTKDRDRRRKNK